MPYSGPPSKACEKCRQRKIRCDQNPDGCSQCEIIHQTCPGYRNYRDLLFRNQTNAIVETVRRAKVKSQPKHKRDHNGEACRLGVSSLVAVKTSTLLGKQNLSEGVTRALPSPVNSLPMSLGDLGVCYFMDRFVLGMAGSVQQYMHTSVSIAYQSDPQLLACMQAVGLAALSNIEVSVNLMTSAHRYYGIALQLTNSALQFRADAIKDSTVLAVMTLSLWENVTGSTLQSLTAWRNHVQGVVELIRLRGSQQFETVAGLKMFLQVFMSILMSCFQKGLYVPSFAVMLWHEAARRWNLDTTGISWRVQELAIRLANLRAGIKDGSCFESDAIISEALIIDNTLASMFEKPSVSWQYKIKYNDTYPKLAYQCIYHVYSCESVCQTWNSMRLGRIILNEIILTQLSDKLSKASLKNLTTGDQSQHQSSIQTLKQMTADVLASVPQKIGYISLLEAQKILTHAPNLIHMSSHEPIQNNDPVIALHTHFNHPSSVGSLSLSAAEDELPIMRGSSGCLLTWHLYHIGTMNSTSVEARQWITNVLRFESRVTGIAQATLFADIIEKQVEIGKGLRRDEGIGNLG